MVVGWFACLGICHNKQGRYVNSANFVFAGEATNKFMLNHLSIIMTTMMMIWLQNRKTFGRFLTFHQSRETCCLRVFVWHWKHIPTKQQPCYCTSFSSPEYFEGLVCQGFHHPICLRTTHISQEHASHLHSVPSFFRLSGWRRWGSEILRESSERDKREWVGTTPWWKAPV